MSKKIAFAVALVACAPELRPDQLRQFLVPAHDYLVRTDEGVTSRETPPALATM